MKPLRSIAVHFETWKQAKDYAKKNGMTLTDLVTEALKYAIDASLKIEKTTTVKELKK